MSDDPVRLIVTLGAFSAADTAVPMAEAIRRNIASNQSSSDRCIGFRGKSIEQNLRNPIAHAADFALIEAAALETARVARWFKMQIDALSNAP
jgi:hypothetical protein